MTDLLSRLRSLEPEPQVQGEAIVYCVWLTAEEREEIMQALTQARIAELKAEIEGAPCWGAGVSVRLEELRALEKAK